MLPKFFNRMIVTKLNQPHSSVLRSSICRALCRQVVHQNDSVAIHSTNFVADHFWIALSDQPHFHAKETAGGPDFAISFAIHFFIRLNVESKVAFLFPQANAQQRRPSDCNFQSLTNL